MKLNTLYKLTTTGKTQMWRIEVSGGKYRTVSGQIDGKKTTSKWTSCTPKNVGRANATTAKEQALKEAKAKHQKKLDSNYTGDINKCYKKKFYEPMLAHKFDTYSKLSKGVLCQPKLDGIRCIVTSDGMFTRTGKEIISAPHIRENLDSFFKKNPNAILDGELYCHECKDDFNRIISLVRKTKPNAEDLKESANTIEYWVYDAPRLGCLDERDFFSERFELLKNMLSEPFAVQNVRVVNTKAVRSSQDLDRWYEEYLEDGFEGQMVRIDGPYENKRSKFLLKRKEFVDEEYTILAVEEGVGNRIGTIGNMMFETDMGKRFKSNVKGTFEYMTGLWNDRENLIGKRATIKYFSLTPDGVPRFPYVIAIRDYE